MTRTARAPRIAGLALFALFASAIVACTLFDDDPPSRSCKIDSDCYRSQGEHCVQDTHTCETVDANTSSLAQDAP